MIFGWRRRRQQLLQEMEQHLALQTQENLEAGMPAEEAQRAARQKFGNTLTAVEESLEVWGGVWLERLANDARYAVRGLRGVPAYTLTLVVTLALGLGSVTAMLAIVESILMRPMPLPHPEQLVQIYAEEGVSGMSASPRALSYPAINGLRSDTRSFAGVGGYNTMVRPVRTKDDTRIGLLIEVAPDFLSMLGVEAQQGRVLGPQDITDPGVVVTDEFWHERLHADRHAVGSTMMIAGRWMTVVGVLRAGVHVPLTTGAPAVYLPIAIKAPGQGVFANSFEDAFGIESAVVIARLKPGVTRAQALADAESVFAHVEKKPAEQARHLAIRSYRSLIVNEMERPLLALLGGVGVLLLIACANSANLQIGRAANRMAEMSVRSALGASFARLLQQLLMESVLLSLAGGALGGGIAYAVVGIVRRAYGAEFPRFDELAVKPLVTVAIAVLAMLVGVAATIAPLVAIRRQITGQFTARNVTRRTRLPGLLVALQVALTCVLLVISGLFVRTLQSLENVKLGFDPKDVTTLVIVPENENAEPEHLRQMEIGLLHRFETMPGVQSVTMQSEVPFSSYNMTLNGTTEIAGRAYRPGDSAMYSLVSTNFVHTSGIRLLQGRSFAAADESSAAMVALVNEAFVRKYCDEREALGAVLHFHREKGETDADLPFTQAITVVGVVENEVQGGDLGAPHDAMVYLDNLQLPASSFLTHIFTMSAQYAIRSPLAPASLAAEVRGVLRQDAPTMVEMSLQPMEASIGQSLGQRKLALRLVASFAGAALVLSAVGMYGVLAYAVARRRREIGIRMALGSTRPDAAKLVMRQAGAMVLLGLLPGIVGAWAAAYVVRGFLYGVQPLDGMTLLAVGGVLLLVAGCAGSIPALRAASVDPLEALRAE